MRSDQRVVVDGVFPYREFVTTAERNGVLLRQHGPADAPALVFVPGMTGGGQATLHLALGCLDQLRAAGRPHRLLWVDYTAEQHVRLEDLQETVFALLGQALGDAPCRLWCESLGNLVAPPARCRGTLRVAQHVLISPFVHIPQLRLAVGLVLMRVSPAPLYRLSMVPMGRLLFGPTGDRPDHVFLRAVAAVPRKDAFRRSAWLWQRDFAAWFAGAGGPAKVWMGAKDRLIDRAHEQAFFRRLAEQGGWAFSLLARAGHVVTDRRQTAALFDELCDWVLA